MNEKIKVGIIGFGKMGRIRKKELDAHPGFEVVAISDITEPNESYKGVQFFSRWEDLIALKLDAVFVCTFNKVIPDITCAALEAGTHVFSEKPPGRTVADIQRMIDAEKKSGKKLKFGFNHRFHYAIMEAKALVDSGRYGKILWARGIYGKAGGESFVSNWRSSEDFAGGGILLDQGIHMLDLLLFFLGEFDSVQSFVEQCYWKEISMEDNVFALLRNNSGQVAMVHSSATQWRHKFSLELYLENGYVSVNGILSSTRSYGEESITFAAKQFESEASAFGKPREETVYFDRDDSWKLEVSEFYDYITGASKGVQGSSNDALSVMSLVHSIYDAGKKASEGLSIPNPAISLKRQSNQHL